MNYMIITISGTPGSGKNTIAIGIAKALKIKAYFIGDFMKKLAEKRKVSLIELSKQAEKDKKKGKLTFPLFYFLSLKPRRLLPRLH